MARKKVGASLMMVTMTASLIEITTKATTVKTMLNVVARVKMTLSVATKIQNLTKKQEALTQKLLVNTFNFFGLIWS